MVLNGPEIDQIGFYSIKEDTKKNILKMVVEHFFLFRRWPDIIEAPCSSFLWFYLIVFKQSFFFNGKANQ